MHNINVPQSFYLYAPIPGFSTQSTNRNKLSIYGLTKLIKDQLHTTF